MVNKTGPHLQPQAPAIKQKPSVSAGKRPEKTAGELAFRQALQEARGSQQVIFSAHARERIESRRISLDSHDMHRIEEVMDKVQAKGSRSSLLMLGEVALVASVTNRTIITAVDGAEAREHIFTDIDSAVIVR